MIGKLQMINPLPMNCMSTTLLISSGQVTYNIWRNSGLFGRDPSICTTNKTASSRCTFVNNRVLSLSDKESETTLPEIWGEVICGLREVASKPHLCVESGVACRSAIALWWDIEPLGCRQHMALLVTRDLEIIEILYRVCLILQIDFKGEEW